MLLCQKQLRLSSEVDECKPLLVGTVQALVSNPNIHVELYLHHLMPSVVGFYP